MKATTRTSPANYTFITLQVILGIGAGLWYAGRFDAEGKTISESLITFYLYINIIFFAVVATTGCIHAFLINRHDKVGTSLIFSLLCGVATDVVFWMFFQALGAPFLFIPLLGYVTGFHIRFRREK